MKFTIIIPIYNSEEHLVRCINSVLSQTETDFELLLINDGSTDLSGKICDDFSAKDNRISVFHIKNGGVGVARNIGLQESKGEFICFIDSDDWVADNYLTELLANFEIPEIDLSIQGFISVDEINQTKTSLGSDLIEADNLTVLFEDKEIFKYGYVCSKLFKAEIITKNRIVFPTNYNLAEDLSFFLIYLSKCRLVKFDDKFNYFYINQPNSLSKTLKKPKEYLNRYEDYKKIIDNYYPKIFKEIYGKNVHFKKLTRGVGGSIFYFIQSLYLNKEFDKEYRIQSLKKMNKEDFQLMKNFILHLNHPMFQFAFFLVTKKKYILADILFKIFMK